MTKARTLADNFAADINGITAGTGITGGGTSGTVTITNEMATTITAKGDLLAGTGNAAFDNLAAGASGETLVADSSASVGLRYQEPKAGNPVINSSFQVWQRGTSVSVAASTTAYTSDRWMLSTGATQASTVSRQVTNDTTNLPNIQYCARVQRNSGQTGTAALQLAQSFESINSIPFAGKTVTISFYARKGADFSAASSQMGLIVYTGTGTDQNILVSGYTGSAQPINQSPTLTTTWQRFSYSATLATTATEIAINAYFVPVGTASTNDYFEITGVQLEVGSVATPFKTQGVTLAGELAACQRYYVRFNDPTNTRGNIGSAIRYSSTNALALVYLPVTMRVAPTAVESASLEVSDVEATNIAITAVTLASTYASNKTLGLDLTAASGFVANRPYFLRQANTTAGYLGVIAEL
jgi:hypothetical protein